MRILRSVFVAVVVLSFFPTAYANSPKPKWEKAKVLKMTQRMDGVVAVVVPVGNSVVGAASRTSKAYYWIRCKKMTYVIHNYSNGFFVEKWLLLPIGGAVKVYRKGRNLHLIDDNGKERTARILKEIVNKPAKGAAKATPK